MMKKGEMDGESWLHKVQPHHTGIAPTLPLKVKCAILLLGIGGVLISLSKAMSP